LRDDVDAVVGVTSERQAPQPLIAQHDSRLVLELVAPTLSPGNSDELTEIVLNLFGKRSGPDDAGVELEILEHPPVSPLKQAGADIQPTGIRPVTRIGGPEGQIFWGEDALPDK